MKNKHVAIIGAGLGGLSAAISLAAKGYRVSLCEKNNHLGGKLNLLERDGFSFDMGPSILTLPHYFRDLFQRAGRNMDDYIKLVPVRPHWRNVFEDGTVVDLHPDDNEMACELSALGEGVFQQFKAFKAYAKQQYEIVARGYFDHGLDNATEMLRFYGPWTLLRKLDSLRTMDKAVRKKVSNPYLIDIFNFFIKYVGSSANQAPAFFNLMPHIQFGYDLWYVEGGMVNIARGFERLLRELQVDVHLGCEVKQIAHDGKTASAVDLAEGRSIAADVVVSNMEVIPAHERLLQAPPKQLKRLEKFEPSCSGLVIHLGTDRIYPQLAHHNFFYARDQRRHFDTVFREHALPDDPTLYVVAPTRTDPSQAPSGCDNIKVLPHIPYINDTHPYTESDYAALKDRVLEKLERMGLKDLQRHIVCEHVWTPIDIERTYFSNKGSIYGVVSDLKKNYGFRAPKRSAQLRNLYFVGGSVNPGGGMPMVVLCGQKVADCIEADGH